jgi:hypothetical protein
MKLLSIMTFDYLELTSDAKSRVIYWLDEFPIDYENEDGSISYQYFYELDDSEIDEHCQINGYIFDKNGKPVHNLIEG